MTKTGKEVPQYRILLALDAACLGPSSLLLQAEGTGLVSRRLLIDIEFRCSFLPVKHGKSAFGMTQSEMIIELISLGFFLFAHAYTAL